MEACSVTSGHRCSLGRDTGLHDSINPDVDLPTLRSFSFNSFIYVPRRVGFPEVYKIAAPDLATSPGCRAHT